MTSNNPFENLLNECKSLSIDKPSSYEQNCEEIAQVLREHFGKTRDGCILHFDSEQYAQVVGERLELAGFKIDYDMPECIGCHLIMIMLP
jgi:Rad3-related DNA helicase